MAVQDVNVLNFVEQARPYTQEDRLARRIPATSRCVRGKEKTFYGMEQMRGRSHSTVVFVWASTYLSIRICSVC